MRSRSQFLQIARNDLGVYSAAAYAKFEMPRHIALLIEKLEAVEKGQIKRLMVSMPPRHGKTLLTSQLFPAWYLGRDPSRSIAVVTYGLDLAQDLGRKVQQSVTNRIHKAIFPGATLATDLGSAERLEFQAGGSFFAVSRAGVLTGRGVNLLICDDLLKDQNEARSQAIRRSIVDFYQRVAISRLTPDGAIVLVGTRWGKGDLFDYLLDERGEDQWEVINFPALSDSETDPLGRAIGEALWPSRFTVKHLQHKRYEMGPSAFTCLYQGRPAESDGLIFKTTWWQRYAAPPALKRVVLSLDPAFKTGKENDYSAIQVWGESEIGFFLLHNWKGRVPYPDLKRILISFAETWRPEHILIEDAASGQSLIQELLSTTSLPIKAIRVDRDKISRAEACTGLLEAGRVHLPDNAPWLQEYLDELSSFPNGAHDDLVDATTQALAFLRGENKTLGWIEYLKTFFSPDGATKPVAVDVQRAKERTFQFEQRMRGITTSNGRQKFLLEPPAPCACGSVCMIRIANFERCNECGLQRWPGGRAPIAEVVTRADILSGRIRPRSFQGGYK